MLEIRQQEKLVKFTKGGRAVSKIHFVKCGQSISKKKTSLCLSLFPFCLVGFALLKPQRC